MGYYTDRLKHYDADWQNAEVKKSEFTPLLDGKYQVTVESARIEENKEYGSLWLVWELSVVEGQYEGHKIFKRARLDEPERFSWVKTDFHRMGITLWNLSEIEDVLPHVLDIILEVQLKTTKPNAEGKTYQNCYINRRVDNQDIDDSDMPF